MHHNPIRKVAFVGTGIMGAAIAGHILDAGFDLVVHNRTRAKAEGLLARGARWASSPAEATAGADVVLTMVGYPSEVEDVYLASDGILRAAAKGTWLVDLTTSSPQLARDIHDAAEVMDLHAFDCPVTGGQVGAEAGTLTLIVGAREADVTPVLPVLRTFSSKIMFFDAPGAGQTAKLCNQVSLASCMIGYADALALAEQGGVDADKLLELLASGTGGSGAAASLAPKSLAGDWRPGFMMEHFRKDIALSIVEAQDHDLTLPGAETAFTLVNMICGAGGGRLGTQALTLLYADQAQGAAAGLDWSLVAPPQDGCGGCGDGCGGGGCGDDGCGHHHHDHGDGCCCGRHGE